METTVDRLSSRLLGGMRLIHTGPTSPTSPGLIGIQWICKHYPETC